MIKLHSTNYKTPDVDFKTAVLKGQALDKGLYMLNEIPKLSDELLYSFKDLTLTNIAFTIISLIIGDVISETNLKKILKTSLNFPVPIERIINNDYMCYLDQGPTASFKDFGARTLARIMEYFLQIEDRQSLILTATSGDTGGAVSQAFYEMQNIKVLVIYKENR
ncbi:MAG: hypothetical protein ACXAEX_15155 [Promethearchaeota archaeon]|jgi:threonine synthase